MKTALLLVAVLLASGEASLASPAAQVRRTPPAVEATA